MNMPDRYVHLSFQIDTNRINARGSLPNMNQLEEWRANGVIRLEISKVAHDEASFGNSVRREKASSYIFSHTQATTPNEVNLLKNIERVVFPSGIKTQNDANDVEILFNAKKYCHILITDDGDSERQSGGILGNTRRLEGLGIRVMRDSNAVVCIQDKIKMRDEWARKVSTYTGQALPDWVGKD